MPDISNMQGVGPMVQVRWNIRFIGKHLFFLNYMLCNAFTPIGIFMAACGLHGCWTSRLDARCHDTRSENVPTSCANQSSQSLTSISDGGTGTLGHHGNWVGVCATTCWIELATNSHKSKYMKSHSTAFPELPQRLLTQNMWMHMCTTVSWMACSRNKVWSIW